MRNIANASEQGRKIIRQRPHLDLTVGNARRLAREYDGTKRREGEVSAVYDVIQKSYYAGIAVATRAAQLAAEGKEGEQDDFNYIPSELEQ